MRVVDADDQRRRLRQAEQSRAKAVHDMRCHLGSRLLADAGIQFFARVRWRDGPAHLGDMLGGELRHPRAIELFDHAERQRAFAPRSGGAEHQCPGLLRVVDEGIQGGGLPDSHRPRQHRNAAVTLRCIVEAMPEEG
jgi:hypothetical protein